MTAVSLSHTLSEPKKIVFFAEPKKAGKLERDGLRFFCSRCLAGQRLFSLPISIPLEELQQGFFFRLVFVFESLNVSRLSRPKVLKKNSFFVGP